ncbi:MAG: bile acid:sodium symporter [Prochlorococcaceae cyanobacterium]
MPPIFALFVAATLFTTMLALGLGLRGDAPELLRARPALFTRVLLGSCLLVPLVALLLLKLPASQVISGPARYAIALMALSPSAPLTLRKAGKKGGDRELAASLQVGAALLAILSIPLLADLFRSSFQVEGWQISPQQVALQVGKVQVLPLLLGLLLRRYQPAWAERLRPGLDRLANLLLLLLIVLVLLKTAPVLLTFMGGNLPALAGMAVMTLASLAIGYLLAGRDQGERTTISLVTSMRNPGLALLFASTFAPNQAGVKIAILCYLLVTVLVSIPFLRFQQRQHAAAERLPQGY